jgi:hypothetical protein
MLVCMKRTTLVLEEGLLEGIKREARRRDCDMSDVVNELIRNGLHAKPPPQSPPGLPSFAMGRPKVNLADRDTLEDVMEPV